MASPTDQLLLSPTDQLLLSTTELLLSAGLPTGVVDVDGADAAVVDVVVQLLAMSGFGSHRRSVEEVVWEEEEDEEEEATARIGRG